jgi:hypothetical protein
MANYYRALALCKLACCQVLQQARTVSKTKFSSREYVQKVSLNDKIALQTRLDAFNVLNHPNWTNAFNSDPTSVDWGTISKGPSGPGTPARDLQISGKLIW